MAEQLYGIRAALPGDTDLTFTWVPSAFLAAQKVSAWGEMPTWIPASDPDEPSLTRDIRYAIDVYCKERQRQKAEDTLRKLWRAVEQSADVVMITDRAGTIEYVNPAFEALTLTRREN